MIDSQRKMITPTKTAIALTIVWIALAGPEIAVADIFVFSEGDFENGSVEIVPFHRDGDANISQQTSGGNPDEWLRVASIGRDRNSSTFTAFMLDGKVFDPATQGAINTIDYREDNRFVSNSGGTSARYQFYAPALRQGGRVFSGFRTDAGYARTNTSTTWATLGFDDLSEDDFAALINGGFDTNITPDFSENGDLIQFGFLRATSAGGSPGYTITSGIDNWSVTVNTSPVPEPSMIAPLLAGLLSLAFFKFKRRRA